MKAWASFITGRVHLKTSEILNAPSLFPEGRFFFGSGNVRSRVRENGRFLTFFVITGMKCSGQK